MSRIDIKKRKVHLKIRRNRKEKLAKLRRQYSVAKSEEAKKRVLEKLHKLAPWLAWEEFSALIKAKK